MLMRVPVQFPLIRYNQETLVRLAISAGAVFLVYWTGRLSAPNVLNFGRGGMLAWMTICYTLMGISFLICAASSVAIRWTIIPIGAAFGYLAGLVSQYVASMMFKPRGLFIHTYPSLWESMASIFFVTPSLGGAIAGGFILIFYRGFVSLKRWRT
jgi:hypothetical protein